MGISASAAWLLRNIRGCPASKAAPGPPALVYGAEEPVVMMDDEHGMAVRFVHGVPYAVFLTEALVDALRDRFTPRPTDVFVATYPKCGTTWMQQLVLLLCLGPGNQVTDLQEQAPWIEARVNQGKLKIEDLSTCVEGDSLAQQLPGNRRVFKTHAPFQLMPCTSLGESKVIYVARNVKDACVSAYYHNRSPIAAFYCTQCPRI